MKTTARRRQGYVHDVEIADGPHRLVVDEPASVPGGTDTGPSPTRLLAAALASCTAVTIEMYADRKGWDVGDLEVEVETTYDGYVPSRFETAVSFGAELDSEQRERLIAIAHKCPVHKVLAGQAEVTVTDRAESA